MSLLANNNVKLALTGCVLVVVGIFLNQDHQPETEIESRLMLPEINAQPDSLNSIKVVKAGDQTIVEATKKGDVWTISSLDNYPADVSKIRKFISEVIEARIVEDKTRKPKNFHHLKLTAVTGENADPESKAELVILKTANAQAELLLGGYPKNDNGRYARLNNENQTWQINKKLYSPNEANSWIEKKIFKHFNILDIQAVRRVLADDAQSFSFNRTDDRADYLLTTTVPSDKQSKDSGVMGSYVAAIAGIRMDIPAKRDNQFWPSADVSSIDIGLFKGVKLSLNFAQQTLPLDDSKKDAVADSIAWLFVTAQATTQDETAKALAEKINSKHQIWQYQISDYIYNSMLKTLDNFVEDKVADSMTAQ